jgi:tRNA nucleotidyltransferase (CCA-adding enzyme)
MKIPVQISVEHTLLIETRFINVSKTFILKQIYSTFMKEVLKIIGSTRKEQQEVKKIFNQIKKLIKIPKTKVILGGSAAKGTFLKGSHDIDIYVKFDQKTYSKKNISLILSKALKNATSLHGSRDYYQIKINDYTVEIIPIIDIKKVENAENITDISPFHTKFVLKNKRYKNDILLAKAFAKANGFYGAESFIQGFSGYSIEILTIYYKGFKNLIKNVSKWKSITVIDPLNAHKGKVILNEAKMVSPIILVDPVQSIRNTTAVVSKEKYSLFIQKAKEYLKHPNKEFFIKKEFSIKYLKKKGELFVIDITPLEGKRDIVGSKILKVYEYLLNVLKNNDFTILNSNWAWKTNAVLWFDIKKESLSKEVKHFGPPIKNKERLTSFQSTWKDYKIKQEKGISYVIIPRKYTEPEQLIKDTLEDPYITSKILNHKLFKP